MITWYSDFLKTTFTDANLALQFQPSDFYKKYLFVTISYAKYHMCETAMVLFVYIEFINFMTFYQCDVAHVQMFVLSKSTFCRSSISFRVNPFSVNKSCDFLTDDFIWYCPMWNFDRWRTKKWRKNGQLCKHSRRIS